MTEVLSSPNFPPVRQRVLEMLAVGVALGLMFLIVNFAHFQLVPVSVTLFACIWDAAIANVLILVSYSMFRKIKPSLPATELALTAIASNLLILLYA
jgi:hypothetical protein